MSNKKKDKRPGQRRGDNHRQLYKRNMPHVAKSITLPIDSQPLPIPEKIETVNSDQVRTSRDYHDKSNLIFAGVVAASTITQVFVSWSQLSKMVEQNGTMVAANGTAQGQLVAMNATLDQMQRDQRPWLSMAFPKLPYLTTDTRIHAEFTIRNTGPTPGTMIRSYARLALSDPDDESIVNELMVLKGKIATDARERQMVLVPDANLKMPVDSSLMVDQTEYALVRDGTKKLVMLSYIKYLDSEGKEYETLCNFIYRPSKDDHEGTMATYGLLNFMQ